MYAKVLFTVTDFLDTNYVELLQAAEPVASLEQIIVLRGAPAEGTISWSEFVVVQTLKVYIGKM